MDEKDSMHLLSALEASTGWSDSGDLLAANDPEDNAGLGDLLEFPHHHQVDDGDIETIEPTEEATNIANTVVDMVANGVVEDLMVIINTPDGDQILLTTIERNDHIIGCLQVAVLNWHSSQIAAQNYYEEEEDV